MRRDKNVGYTRPTMDPNRDFYRSSMGAGIGIFQAFVPTGAVGILAGVAILMLILIASGAAGGIWLFVAAAVLIVSLALIPRAIKAEIRREDRRPRRLTQDGSLPDDSQISEEERRQAMRDYRSDGKDT